MNKIVGQVEFFNATRRFGFIAVTDEHDIITKYFVLGSRVISRTAPVSGAYVEFEPGEKPVDPRKYAEAFNIRVLTAEAAWAFVSKPKATHSSASEALQGGSHVDRQ